MALTEDDWSQVTDWFDRLAELDPAARRDTLAGQELAPDVREWLDRLLAAHDTPEPLLVDRTIDAVAAELARGDGPPPPRDWTGQRIDAWRIVGEIERGGMATVVLAERDDGRYERRVALKVLHAAVDGPAHRSSLEREIRLLAGLSHHGIVHLIDGGLSEQGWPYIAMEYVEGEPIDAWCDRTEASLEVRVELLRQVAEAVAYAHSRLVVHADLKPGNVLVDGRGRARLVDFGIGRLLDSDARSPRPTFLRCSPAWASPEQLAGEAAGVASDVHGLGLLMVRLLTGRNPRTGGEVTRLLAGLAPPREIAPLSAGPEVPYPSARLRGDLEAICARATAVDPARRYRSAEALERDLAAWQHDRPVDARNGGTGYRIGRWLARNRLAAAASGLALAAILAGSGVATWQAVRAQAEAVRASAEAARAETIKEFLLTMFTAADPWLAGGAELDLRDVLAQGSRQLETDESLDPGTRVELLTTLGDVEVALGWHEQADAMFERASRLLDRHPDLPDVQRARLGLERAVLASIQGDYQAQEAALGRVLGLLPEARDADAIRLHARTWGLYASLYARQNRAADAERAFERLEALLAAADDPMTDLRINLLSSRAVLAYNRGDMDSAYRAMQAERELQLAHFGGGDPKMVRTLSNLAAVAAQLGRLDEALAHDQEAVRLARDVYPEDHPSVARALYALGDTLRQHGRFDDALGYLDEARAIQHAADLPTERALTDLVRARTLLALGRGRPAADIARDAREILEEAWGPTERSVIQALEFELLGHALAGDASGREATEDVARAKLARLEPPARWQTVAQMLRWRIARGRLESGDPDGALALLAEAAEAPDDVAVHPSVTLRLSALGLMLDGPPGGGTGSVRTDPTMTDRLLSALDEPAANDDARAFALCAVARVHPEPADPHRIDALAQLAALRESSTLSFEGRRDAECPALQSEPGPSKPSANTPASSS
ncbi:serine/threonine-protein kinase [Halomonas denitrificans]|nr:serine/threonine-protein kinase [Halomonas denitrificans]